MKIEEAVGRLEGEALYLEMRGFSKRVEAVKLGIEALVRIQANRKADFPLDYSPLKGETDD